MQGCYRSSMDRSSGYERIAPEFLARRGSAHTRDRAIGVAETRNWARSLRSGATVVDVGCGPGFPITEVLVQEGLSVFGVDAALPFVEAFRRNLPNTPVVCEAVQDSTFFDRTFDAALAWGLMFLLTGEDQRQLIRRFGEIVIPRGRLLFTSPARADVWNDAMTEQESRSLGAEEYRRLLDEAGFLLLSEYEDIGENHYFDAVKK